MSRYLGVGAIFPQVAPERPYVYHKYIRAKPLIRVIGLNKNALGNATRPFTVTWPKSLLVDRKDGRTDGRTHALIESLITTSKLYRQGVSIQFLFRVKSPIQ